VVSVTDPYGRILISLDRLIALSSFEGRFAMSPPYAFRTKRTLQTSKSNGQNCTEAGPQAFIFPVSRNLTFIAAVQPGI
jgi:hypothetical protein